MDPKQQKPAETPAAKPERPKRAPLNVEEFWKHEQALGINQRRARSVLPQFSFLTSNR
jgi:hypothetical protein